MDWPSQSPDLNPIESCWATLKKKVAATRIPSSLDDLETVVRGGQRLSLSYLRLIDSMPDRIRAVIKAKGGSTKY